MTSGHDAQAGTVLAAPKASLAHTEPIG